MEKEKLERISHLSRLSRERNLTDEEIIERFPWIVESHEVPFDDRVKLQAVMQKYVDNSISSTVNLKHDATPEDIFQIYMDAWESGCKGITAFRDGKQIGTLRTELTLHAAFLWPKEVQ